MPYLIEIWTGGATFPNGDCGSLSKAREVRLRRTGVVVMGVGPREGEPSRERRSRSNGFFEERLRTANLRGR